METTDSNFLNPAAGQPGSGYGQQIQVSRKLINKESLICGLYLGLIGMGLNLVIFLVDPLFATRPVAGSVLGIVNLSFMVLFLLSVRKQVGNYWTFSEAFRSAFLISIINLGFGILWNFILFHLIDKTLGGRIYEVIQANNQKQLLKQGLSQEMIDSQTEITKKLIDPGTYTSLIIFAVTGLVLSIIISLILAAIFKKLKPVFTSA